MSAVCRLRLVCNHADHANGESGECCGAVTLFSVTPAGVSAKAKEAGWTIRKDGTCLCPEHAKGKTKPAHKET